MHRGIDVGRGIYGGHNIEMHRQVDIGGFMELRTIDSRQLGAFFKQGCSFMEENTRVLIMGYRENSNSRFRR